jgi:hypothetical protein
MKMTKVITQMNELRRMLQSHLKLIHPAVYFQRAPKNVPFPHLVYSLEVTNEQEYQETILLDIDGWDMGSDSSALEDLMVKLTKNLDKKTISSGDVTACFFLDKRLPLSDPDTRILRRHYTFHGSLFLRE